MNILGISAYYHDSAACLVRNGEIVAAAQEERFTRVKHDAAFPRMAVAYCLQEAGLKNAAHVDLVAFYERPFLKFDRLLSTYLAIAPKGFRSFLSSMSLWMEQKIWTKEILRNELNYEGTIVFADHHESHAASAFFPSPFDDAAILTIDGVGEFATTTIGRGRGNRVELEQELQFPHSLGLLYSAFTYYLGFRVNSGEYKVMGLAPYGEPRFRDLILSELLDLKEDGSYRLNLSYFDFLGAMTMTNDRFSELFGGPVREPETALTQRHMDIARSIQAVTDEAVSRMARHARSFTGCEHLCMAGGVALNCVANGRIVREGTFKTVWVQPAAGDAGGALGAALVAWHHYSNQPRTLAKNGRDRQSGSLLGPQYDVRRFLEVEKLPFTELADEELFATASELLASGKVIGWYQGRMEFGPRALGNRSILADPRVPDMQQTLNLKIKFRETFRPFAPAVLAERASDYFELTEPSPYMLLVAPIRQHLRVTRDGDSRQGDFTERARAPRSGLPAVTHVDFSARVQTVAEEDNPRFHRLLSHFETRTGCAVLVNTSFNVRGEPPVCTPADAWRCFARTDMDFLFMDNFLLERPANTPSREVKDPNSNVAD